MKLYFDIDTQIDFLFPAGALYAPGAETKLPRIQELNREALSPGSRLISTMCAHAEDDPEFKVWPPHCVLGTVGQSKPCATLLDKRVSVPREAAGIDVSGAAQILLAKAELDLFSNPNLDGILRALAPAECVVYGVVTEYCVKLCAQGLLDRGYRVTVIGNAIQSLDPAAADGFLKDFAARGGTVA